MEFKGTKGEWVIENTPDYITPKCSTIEIYSLGNMNGWICKVQNNGVIEHLEGKANALLISKAPEMLEMLKELREIFDKYEVDFQSQFFKYKQPLEQLIKSATEINE
jgi:hypothetical protein